MLTAVTRSMLLFCAFAVAMGHPAWAAPKPKQAAMVIDANTGQVLYNKDGDAKRFPASLTKMMTLYMLFGEIETGRSSFKTPIKISARANGMAPSKIGLEVGDEIAAIDAIKILVVKSANDIAVAVAEHIGGTEYQFARMMTEKAHQIGMRNTTFRNASGLPNSSQLTTARDMLTLALRLRDDYPQHYHLFSTTSVTYRGKVYKTHNSLLRRFPGMDGLKTGYTRASGFNLVSSVQANGKNIVGAVFGGKTAKARNALMRSILFKALEKASTKRTRPSSGRLIAVERRRAPEAKPEAKDVAWAAETAVKKAAPRAQRTVPASVPMPVPAERPKNLTIASVLDEGDASDQAAEEAAPAAGPPPRLDLDALRAAMSESEPQAATVKSPSAQASAASPAPSDIASLIRNSIVDGTSPGQGAAAAKGAADAEAARAPSTLGAQARSLAEVQTAAVAPPSAESPPSIGSAPIGSGFEIQIGAYGSATEAQAKLETIRSRVGELLDGHGGVLMPVQKADRQIFRARFVSFDERSATSTCLELRRRAVDCLVMRAE